MLRNWLANRMGLLSYTLAVIIPLILVILPGFVLSEGPEGPNTCSFVEKWVSFFYIKYCMNFVSFSYEIKSIVRDIETYQERVTSWCLGFPPRCSTYKIRTRPKNKTLTLPKTKIVRGCCGKYYLNIKKWREKYIVIHQLRTAGSHFLSVVRGW